MKLKQILPVLAGLAALTLSSPKSKATGMSVMESNVDAQLASRAYTAQCFGEDLRSLGLVDDVARIPSFKNVAVLFDGNYQNREAVEINWKKTDGKYAYTFGTTTNPNRASQARLESGVIKTEPVDLDTIVSCSQDHVKFQGIVDYAYAHSTCLPREEAYTPTKQTPQPVGQPTQPVVVQQPQVVERVIIQERESRDSLVDERRMELEDRERDRRLQRDIVLITTTANLISDLSYNSTLRDINRQRFYSYTPRTICRPVRTTFRSRPYAPTRYHFEFQGRGPNW